MEHCKLLIIKDNIDGLEACRTISKYKCANHSAPREPMGPPNRNYTLKSETEKTLEMPPKKKHCHYMKVDIDFINIFT